MDTTSIAPAVPSQSWTLGAIVESLASNQGESPVMISDSSEWFTPADLLEIMSPADDNLPAERRSSDGHIYLIDGSSDRPRFMVRPVSEFAYVFSVEGHTGDPDSENFDPGTLESFGDDDLNHGVGRAEGACGRIRRRTGHPAAFCVWNRVSGEAVETDSDLQLV